MKRQASSILDSDRAILASQDVLVAEAAAFLGIKEIGSNWADEVLDQFMPSYEIVGSTNVNSETTLFENWIGSSSGSYQSFVSQIKIPKDMANDAAICARELEASCKRLITYVRDDKLPCYISPLGEKTVRLSEDQFQFLSDQFHTVYCTSYLLLKKENESVVPALITFKMPDLRILVQKAKPRNWGNQSGRALGVGEKKKIDEAILRLTKSLDANADKFKLIHVPQTELIEFLMQTANLPTSTNKDGSKNKDGFGAKSLKNYLSVKHQEFLDRVKPNGRTTQTAIALWQMLKKQDTLP